MDKNSNLDLIKETEHFIISYTKMDKPCIDKVLKRLEDNYISITRKFKEQLENKQNIEIYYKNEELHNALKLSNAPNWIRGGVRENIIVITSPLNPPPGSNFDNVLNTAIHEFIHIIINKINKFTPRWLNEGIASYEGKDNNEIWIKETVKNGLINGKVPTFEDLDTGNDFEKFFAFNGYQYSYTIVEYIIEEFGYNKLHDLIKFPKKYIDIFGINEKELQNNWLKYINNNYLTV
ncbi:peptidase MA family metallohydrolase [Clostridium sp. SHJSY1]|uniref:peptidase MA family metallohydrolase n=1 Tax=Clostridium sp. SHJSY1 TaxID=2942483 RepID=UPI0028751C9F|nr:peptidase MA family metallohydrolase [Clostridium sp. SHJSY1]MDS0524589.1 peptidase MA family metallohydrolase [Clostridium sp. SHJSY1]